MDEEPEVKKQKVDMSHCLEPEHAEKVVTCKHFVKRKKRFCKMTVGKNKEYCGEHEPQCNILETESINRIPCPLDAKHTIYKRNLYKHLKICNARPKTNLPSYICPGINSGSDDDEANEDNLNNLKLQDISNDYLLPLVENIEKIYKQFIDGKIQESFFEHDILKSELSNEEYGTETMKHLVQTASILGNLNHLNLIKAETSFIEFGAGKGQVSYWLARLLIENSLKSKVILVDRASLRHKKDNKIEDNDIVLRIRADIADFKMDNLDEIKDFKNVIAVSKHLCGAATDLTLRCLLTKNNADNMKPTCKAFFIALCCHHRCEWKSFVGKKFFKENNFNKKDFVLITKMVSWAICGSGMSRERRKELEKKCIDVDHMEANQKTNILGRNKKEEIGKMCKRILDYSRLCYMLENGFECYLKYYVRNNVTLENVCLIGKRIFKD